MLKTKCIYLLSICVFAYYPSCASGQSLLTDKSVPNNNATVSDTTNKSQLREKNAEALKSGDPQPANAGKKARATLTTKVISVAAAVVIGTPTCIIRRTKYEERYGISSLSNINLRISFDYSQYKITVIFQLFNQVIKNFLIRTNVAQEGSTYSEIMNCDYELCLTTN